MTYTFCKRLILRQKSKGTLNTADMMEKLDVFYLANRITKEQYEELVALIEAEEV